jgi:imidazolonepropionase-like amidohydrolase
MNRLSSIAAVCLLAPLASAGSTRAFVGARIIPIVGADIERGTLVITDGKISAVGSVDDVVIPADAERIDVTGKVLMPGLVCTHSHVGQVEGGDDSAPLHPDVRAFDSIDVRHPSIQRAQAGGITTANIMPGSGLLMSGQTVYVKLKDGASIDDLAIRNADGSVAGGMKMANGTNPQGSPPMPETRAKGTALVREQFLRAQEYRARRAAITDPAKQPPRDLGLDALVEVLEGKRVVHHHTHRHDDILTILRLKQEFGFRVVLHHVSEGWLVADEIARAAVPCSIITVDSPGGKLEAANLSFETGAVLERAGVLVAYHTDDPITDSRLFLRSAGIGVRAGMTRKNALFALTMAGAIMLDLDRRIGSLEAGKDADFIVLSGDPLSVYTHVEQTWIDGGRVFDRADPKDLRFAQGGEGAGDREQLDACCLKPGGDS